MSTLDRVVLSALCYASDLTYEESTKKEALNGISKRDCQVSCNSARAGREATCTIETIKVTAPGGGASALTRQKIVSVLKTRPEGEYQLLVNDEPPVAVRYSNGHWLDGQH